MKRRAYLVVALMALLTFAACGDEGQECGEGTVADGDQCVPDGSTGDDVECGEGTEEVNGECVPVDSTECGEGTVRNDAGECVPEDEPVECGEGTELQNGECVSTVEEIECGPDTELVDGECVSSIEEIDCGEGTILIDGACELIDPFDGIDAEPGEPNDPFFGGTPGALEFGAEGETVLLTGTISAAEETPDGLVPDFDVFVFEAEAGQRVQFEGTAVGAPNVALAVVFLGADEDDDRGFVRLAFPFESRNAAKEMVLPFEGAYMVRVGTANETATFFDAVTDGGLGFGGIAGDPSGSDDFTWILGATLLGDEDPETFAGNASFSFTGDVSDAPQALVDVDAGRIVALTLETAPAVAGNFFATDTNYGGFQDNVGLTVVPEGGLLLTVDSVFDRSLDTSFTLTGVEQPLIDEGTLTPGTDVEIEGDSVGNNIVFHSFTIEAPTVVSIDAQPAEGSDANLALFLLSPDLSETLAVSNDDTFGEAANAESVQAFIAEPGTYLAAVFHEVEDLENGNHPYNVTISPVAPTAFEPLAVAGEQTLTAGELAAEGSEEIFLVPVEAQGFMSASAAPGEDLDVEIQVFTGPFLRARGTFLADLEANDGIEGETDAVEGPVAAGNVLVRVANANLDAVNGAADVTVGLAELLQETEPNDDAGDANDLGIVGEDGVLLAGELAADVDTTADFFTFNVESISEVTVGAVGFGANPAVNIRISVFDDENLTDALASAEAGVDFFGGEILPEVTLNLEPGQYVAVVEQIDDAPEGGYLVNVDINQIFDCLPGSTSCDGVNVSICADGFEFDIIECAETAACNEEGPTAGCGALGEEEPNNDLDNATLVGTPADGRTDLNGTISEGDDADFFTFTLDGRARVTATTGPGAPPALADTTLALQDSEGEELAFNDDANGLFSEVSEVLEAGTYTLVVNSFGTGTGGYTLSLDIELAACEIEGELACDGDDLTICDGFDVAVQETCDLGCVVDEVDGAACVLPEFPIEEEPNNGPNLDFNVIDELPFLVGGSIGEEGQDQDWYVLDITQLTNIHAFTSSQGLDNDVDTQMFLCTVEQALSLEGCGFRSGTDLINDDDGGEGLFSDFTVLLDPGMYFLVVQSFLTRQGDYLLTVEEVLDPEPNNTLETAIDADPLPFQAIGVVDLGDKDWYAFSTERAVRAIVTVDSRGGDDDFNAFVFACPAEALELGNCDRNDNLGSADGDLANGVVTLSVDLIEPGDYIFVVQGDDDLADEGGYVFGLELVPGEINDTAEQALPIGINSPVFGSINPGTDEDFFVLEVPEELLGVEITFETFRPEGVDLTLDTRLTLCSEEQAANCGFGDDNLVQDDDDGDGLLSFFTFTFDTAGTYFVVVESFSTRTGDYELLISTPGEPNNSAADATDANLGDVIEADIITGDDVDFYVVEVTDADLGVEFTFTTASLGNDNDVDTQMFMCSEDQAEICGFGFGNNIARNDDIDFPANAYSSFAFTFDEAGFYFIGVQSFQTNTGEYSLTIADPR